MEQKMRKLKNKTWEQQLEYMLANREKENEKQIKDFLKKNGDVMKVIYKTDKISDILKKYKKNRADNKKNQTDFTRR